MTKVEVNPVGIQKVAIVCGECHLIVASFVEGDEKDYEEARELAKKHRKEFHG